MNLLTGADSNTDTKSRKWKTMNLLTGADSNTDTKSRKWKTMNLLTGADSNTDTKIIKKIDGGSPKYIYIFFFEGGSPQF